YVERIGQIATYGSIETLKPIDTNQPVKITFTKSDTSVSPAVNTTYTVPSEYLSVLSKWTDTSRTDASQRSERGRIAILKPVGVDSKDKPKELLPGDKISIQY